MEPWLQSYYWSSERLSTKLGDIEPTPGITFRERKKMLEGPHQGQSFKILMPPTPPFTAILLYD